jgi:hypothetical protein
MGAYREVVIETYLSDGEPSSNKVRARPLENQGFSISMKVECATKMRNAHPVGTCFLIQAQVIDPEGGSPFLYTSWQWKYEVIARTVAIELVAARSNH